MWSVGCGYKTMKKLNYHTVRVRFQLLVIFTVLSGTKGEAELSDCRVDIDPDWTVRGSCHYTKADVSRIDDINCTWYRQHNQGNVTLVTDEIVTGQLITEGSKTYYSGNCSFSVTVSTSQQGTHTFYIDLVPGPGRVEKGHIEIEEPGKPESTCQGRTVFPEGQDGSCDCTNNKTQPGNPPPTVGWRGLPPGQPLLLRDIPRRPLESHWICEMRWGPEGNSIVKTTDITLLIVYGPDRVIISNNEDGPSLTGVQDLYEGQTAVWRCTAHTASLPVGISWTGVQCDNGQTRQDCSFTAGRQDDGKTVMCTGRNSRFPDVLHASTSVQLNVTSTVIDVTESTTTSRAQKQTTGPSQRHDDGDNINVGAVVGGGVGAVVVIVTVVVVVVLVKRYIGRSTYAKPGPRLQESNYTDLVINDTVGETHRASPRENKAANDDYENTRDKQTPGDDVQYQNTGSASQTAELNQYTNSEVYAVSGGAPVYQNTGAVSHTCADGVYEDTSQM